jgi:DNA-binding GntR family transcriptional regulator
MMPPNLTPPAEKTLADTAWRLLREDILSGQLQPQARLRLDELKAKYRLGISPLREALLRLCVEGLVIGEAQRGFAVASVSLAELDDVLLTRQRIEGMALSDAIRLGDADWEARIVASFHRLSLAPLPARKSDVEAMRAWEARHREFHQALVAACGSVWLLRFHGQLADQSERYRRVRLFQSVPTKQVARNIAAEHRAIMDAALARDAERASRLMSVHLERTARIVASVWETESGRRRDAGAAGRAGSAPRAKPQKKSRRAR